MNACPNCGKMNVPESNFCRFCGTKILVQAQPQPFAAPNPFDHPSPRPYSWKTDEFQTHNAPRQGRDTGYVEKPTSPFPNPQNQAGPIGLYQPQQMSGPYRCPRCMTQMLPRPERRISTAGWIVFAVLLVFFFPLFWVGLLIKEDVHVCPNCMAKVN